VSGGGGGASGSRMSSSGAVVCGGGFMDVVGDLDLSGGGVSGLDDSGKNSGSVMSEMRALFTPPGRDSRRHQSYMQLQQPGHAFQMHPYYKRPGKEGYKEGRGIGSGGKWRKFGCLQSELKAGQISVALDLNQNP
jgi:hypothetical protein